MAQAPDFGQVAETNLVRANRNRLIGAKSDAEMVLKSIVRSRDAAVRFWTQKNQANAGYSYVWRREETRRVHSLGPGLSIQARADWL